MSVIVEVNHWQEAYSVEAQMTATFYCWWWMINIITSPIATSLLTYYILYTNVKNIIIYNADVVDVEHESKKY